MQAGQKENSDVSPFTTVSDSQTDHTLPPACLLAQVEPLEQIAPLIDGLELVSVC